ncbi:MAG: 5-formyltetrahydrofolate cyclo-ligase [Pseudomonadota bacterium]|nr:5-formyltetrahydrofolate cyclo-ligase [Pseudomonadota bacterium]
MQKSEIRKNILNVRLTLRQDELNISQDRLISKINNKKNFMQSTNVGIYWPVKNEVDPTKLLTQKNNKIFYLPRLRKDKKLDFIRYTSTTKLIRNKYGIFEPLVENEDIISAQELDCVLVPTIAIDNNGNRIGSGGGYYDRTFHFKKNFPTARPYLISLIYEFQLIEHIHSEKHDVKCDDMIISNIIYSKNE